MRTLSRIVVGTLFLLSITAAALFYLLPVNECESVVYSVPQELVLPPKGDYAYLSDSTAPRLLVFSLADNRLAANLPLAAPTRELSVSADGTKLVLLSSIGGNVFVVDAAGRKLERKLKVAGNPSGLAIGSDGKTFYTVLRDTHRLARFDIAGGKPMADVVFDCKACQVTLAPDGKTLIAANEEGVTTFDAQNLGMIKHYENKGQRLPFAISPDGKKLAFSSGGAGVSFLDLGSGTVEERATIIAVGYLAFDADSTSLVASDLTKPEQSGGSLSIMPVHIPEEVKGAIVPSIPPDRSTSVAMGKFPHALVVDVKRNRIDVVAVSRQGVATIEMLDAVTHKPIGDMPLPDAETNWDRFLAWRKAVLRRKDAGRCN